MTSNCGDLVDASQCNPIEEISAWSNGITLAFHILFPVAIAGIIWGRKAIISRCLQHFDKSCLSVFCPAFSKREKLLKWTMTHLPYMEGGLTSIWKDGSQLCTLINSVVPGACPNPHRHWKKPPTHGQALAYKYLGVVPMFTESDLNEHSLSGDIEKRLTDYIQYLQYAISRISHEDDLSFSNHYVARGMGLVTGEQYRKTILYIYPNCKSKQLENLLISVRGPYNSFGSAILHCEDLGKGEAATATASTQIDLNSSENNQKSFFKALSTDFTYLLSLKYVKQPTCDIHIQIYIEKDRAKIVFIPKNSGVYEVCLTTNGEHISGSPYNINIEKNRSGIADNMDSCDSPKSKIKRNIRSEIKMQEEKLIVSEVLLKLEENNNSLQDGENSTVHDLKDLVINEINEDENCLNEKEACNEIIIAESEDKLDSGIGCDNMKDINDEAISDTGKHNGIIEKGTIEVPNNGSIESENQLEENNNLINQPKKHSISDLKEGDVCYLILNESNNNINGTEEKINTDSESSDGSENWNVIVLEPNQNYVHTLHPTSLVIHDTKVEASSSVESGNVSDVSESNVKEAAVPKDGIDFKENYTKCREFWDKLSSSSNSLTSSCVSLSDSTDTSGSKKAYWLSQQSKDDYYQKSNEHNYRYRSLDYIKQRMKLTRSVSLKEKYSSVDDLNITSVKERRHVFLNEKNNNLRKQYSLSSVSTDDYIQKPTTRNLFGSIHDKIKLFDKDLDNNHRSVRKGKQIPENGTITNKIKERFHKAQSFFKRLETEKGFDYSRRNSLGDGQSKSSFSDAPPTIMTNGKIKDATDFMQCTAADDDEDGDLRGELFLTRKRRARKSLHDIF